MTFQRRLQKVMRDGNLTISDLAFALKRPYARVRTWVYYGLNPIDGPDARRELMESLTVLENKLQS